MKLRKTNKKGFTLVELIVVIAIIAIIAAIAIPTTIVYVGRANDSAAQSEADSVARTLRESVTSAILTDNKTITLDYFKGELREQMGTVEHVTGVTVKYADNTITFEVATDRDVTGSASVSIADTGLIVGSDITAEGVEIEYNGSWPAPTETGAQG